MNTYSEEFFSDIVINISASDMFVECTGEQEDSEKVIAEFNLEYLPEKGVLNSIIYIYVSVCIYPLGAGLTENKTKLSNWGLAVLGNRDYEWGWGPVP